ncbi:MAG: hypothetical protein KDK39_02190 [Leptospiraceae bacterium]|nr:hypothetical protein [Leptospiraceae bacterium]
MLPRFISSRTADLLGLGTATRLAAPSAPDSPQWVFCRDARQSVLAAEGWSRLHGASGFALLSGLPEALEGVAAISSSVGDQVALRLIVLHLNPEETSLFTDLLRPLNIALTSGINLKQLPELDLSAVGPIVLLVTNDHPDPRAVLRFSAALVSEIVGRGNTRQSVSLVRQRTMPAAQDATSASTAEWPGLPGLQALIQAARRPVILMDRPGLELLPLEFFLSLARALRAPLLPSARLMTSGPAFLESMTCNAAQGMLWPATSSGWIHALRQSDLALAIEFQFTEMDGFFWRSSAARIKRLVFLSIRDMAHVRVNARHIERFHLGSQSQLQFFSRQLMTHQLSGSAAVRSARRTWYQRNQSRLARWQQRPALIRLGTAWRASAARRPDPETLVAQLEKVLQSGDVIVCESDRIPLWRWHKSAIRNVMHSLRIAQCGVLVDWLIGFGALASKPVSGHRAPRLVWAVMEADCLGKDAARLGDLVRARIGVNLIVMSGSRAVAEDRSVASLARINGLESRLVGSGQHLRSALDYAAGRPDRVERPLLIELDLRG